MKMFASRRASYKLFDGEEDDCERNIHGQPLASHDDIDVSFTATKPNDKSKTNHRWDHIENVDQFFTLIYEYHQGNGLMCIGLRQTLSLLVFIYVVCFSTFLSQCVSYDVLFNNCNTTTTGEVVIGKRQFKDAIVPHCVSNFHPLVLLTLLLATCFCLWQLVCIGYHLLQLREIKVFYATALEIEDWQLANISWSTVVNRLCALQPKLHLIINQDTITPLDVYQRILRYKNYFVALIYNELLSAKVSLPLVGSFPFLSSGLRLNIEWLLFWGPWSPWKNSYALKSEYKDAANLEILAEKMQRTVMWMGLANLLLFPFIFLYQTIFHFFSYADSVKREPGIFGTRKYAIYGRERLRHFNELDHELQNRLNRSYSYAVRYMDQFFSPVTEIIATKVALVVGSVFAVLALLSAWDEDVLTLEHVITVMAVCGTITVICKSVVPNENLVFCQDFLMRQIVANIHYAPKAWLEDARSNDVCREFSQLFQLRAQCLLEELISPIVTPFILFFSIRHKASEFVLFFHNNTKSVDGLGDVCSYALMDISTDGDGRLASLNDSFTFNNLNEPKMQSLKRMPAYCGKVEMSLLNFATMNPDWVPPPAFADFISRVKECTTEMMTQNSMDVLVPNGIRDLDASVREGEIAGSSLPAFLAQIGSPLTPLAAANMTSTPEALGGRGGAATALRFHKTTERSTGVPHVSTAASDDNLRANETSMVGSLSNINPFIASFAQANQLNSIYQPRNVLENNSRALEMSYNAITLNRLLAANQPNTTHGQRSNVNNNNRLAAGASYGAFGANQMQHFRLLEGTPSSIYSNNNNGASRLGTLASRYYANTNMSTTSNLWGVPELSQPLLNEEDGDDGQGSEPVYHP